jgi:hypothetical protein
VRVDPPPTPEEAAAIAAALAHLAARRSAGGPPAPPGPQLSAWSRAARLERLRPFERPVGR